MTYHGHSGFYASSFRYMPLIPGMKLLMPLASVLIIFNGHEKALNLSRPC